MRFDDYSKVWAGRRQGLVLTEGNLMPFTVTGNIGGAQPGRIIKH